MLDEETRGALQRIASSVKAQVRQVLRAQIVLAAAGGAGNAAIARRLAVGVNTVRKWRGRFAKMDTWIIQRNEHARPFGWTYQGNPLKEATRPLH